MQLSDRLIHAGITIDHEFRPGDLGELIRIHGEQNWRDYGFNAVHEAYCARIAADFVIGPRAKRSRVWLARRHGRVVGSVFIYECPDNVAQLRLLFADDSVRGLGLGRWLVEAAVDHCRTAAFDAVFLWTVAGLQRAIAVYERLGFRLTQTKDNEDWGSRSLELRYDLPLR